MTGKLRFIENATRKRARGATVIGSGLAVHGLKSLFQDNRRRIWVSTSGGVGYLENDRFISINGIPGGEVQAIAQDAGGNLWIANMNLGLFQLLPEKVVQQIPWSRLGRKDFATSLAADPLRGGLWLGFYQGGMAYFKKVKSANRTQPPMDWARAVSTTFNSIGTVRFGPPPRAG